MSDATRRATVRRAAGSSDARATPSEGSGAARKLARWVEIVSWMFVALGVMLPFAFESAPMRVYRETLLQWAYGAPVLPAADARLATLMLGILGGSIAGKWLVHAQIARGPLAEGRPWARDLTLRGVAAWFFVDSIASLALGATFNVWMINLAPVVLVGVPLFLAHRAFDGAPAIARPGGDGRARLLRACLWTALFGASTGLLIAFAGGSPLFAPWWWGLSSLHYDGAAIPDATRRFAHFFFGPIGGCTFAQFLMLAALVVHEGASRRVAVAGVTSITAWFAVDSAYGLASSGLFNILLVNVPAVAVTLPPWLLLARSLREPVAKGLANASP